MHVCSFFVCISVTYCYCISSNRSPRPLLACVRPPACIRGPACMQGPTSISTFTLRRTDGNIIVYFTETISTFVKG